MSIFEGNFEEITARVPEKIFTDITKDFSTAAQGVAELDLIEVTGTERLSRSNLRGQMFRFKATLFSPYLKGYSFDVLEFGYNISLFPVFIEVDNQIAKELKIPEEVNKEFEMCFILKCYTEEEFIEKLSDIFNTDTFKKTVGGVMKIAKERKPRSPLQ